MSITPLHRSKPFPAEETGWARISSTPPFIQVAPRRSAAQMRGIRYEDRVHEHLNEAFGLRYVRSPWIQFAVTGRQPRWCQPDGFIIFPELGKIIVVEVKYNHTAKAYEQLFHLYAPVIRRIFGPGWRVACCEIVKWFDPAVVCPEPAVLREYIEHAKVGEFAVHIWKK